MVVQKHNRYCTVSFWLSICCSHLGLMRMKRFFLDVGVLTLAQSALFAANNEFMEP